MKLSHHTALSLILSGGVYAFSRSIPATTAAFLTGIFIDLDHALDYLIMFGIPRSTSGFFHTFYKGQLTRVFIFFHAWEWVASLGAASFFSGWDPWVTGAFIGMAVHLTADQFWNRPHPLGYFIAYRIVNRFSFVHIFPLGGIDQHRR